MAAMRILPLCPRENAAHNAPRRRLTAIASSKSHSPHDSENCMSRAKFLKAILAGGIGLLLAFGSHARSFDEIKKDGKIIVATEGQYPPFNFFQGAKLAGFEVDLAEALAKKLGVALEWKALSFDALLAGLRQDR